MLHTITAAEIQAKGLKECVEPDAERSSMRWDEPLELAFFPRFDNPPDAGWAALRHIVPENLWAALTALQQKMGRRMMTCLPAPALSRARRTQHPGCWDLLLANSEMTRTLPPMIHPQPYPYHSKLLGLPTCLLPPASVWALLAWKLQGIKDISWRQTGMVEVSQKTAQTLHP